MEAGQIFVLLVVILLAIFVLVTLAKSVRIVPQARAGIVERLGRYQRTLDPGLTVVVPFIDRVLPLLDLREQVVSFPPQPVITQDNLVVSIDTVIYYQVNDPKAATYEIANYIQGIEQLTVTTLRNVIGGMDLERTLTSREEINNALRGVLDDATGKWGIRVNRVELKAIDPPPSIQDSMEKQMRADRDKRAAILNAEGVRQSQILTAEGQKQSAILTAEGDKQSTVLRAEADKQAQILRADGEAKAIGAVFDAIHRGNPDQKLLAYQYLQMMPEIAKGDSNKVWIVPSEFSKALEGLGQAVGRFGAGLAPGAIPADDGAAEELEAAAAEATAESEAAAAAAAEEVRRALQAAEVASDPSKPLPPADLDLSEPAPEEQAGEEQAGETTLADDVAEAATGDLPALGRDLTADPDDERAVHAAARAACPAGGVSLLDVVAIVAAGFAAGAINVVVGSGTMITFPTLLALGYPPVVANVSNTVGLVPGSVMGAWGYREELRGQRDRVLRFGLAAVVGGTGGALLLLALPPGAFEAIVPVLIVLACVLVAAQPWISTRLKERPSGREHGGPVVWLLVLLTAVYGGYFGAAQGVLLLAVLGLGLSDSLQRLNAVKNVQAGLVNLVAGLVFTVVADVDWAVAGLIALGSAAGGLVGARIGRRLPPLVLRVVIVVVGVTAVVVLVLR